MAAKKLHLGIGCQQIEQCHAYGHSIFHLLQNDGMVRVRYIARDLNSPVDRPRVHNDDRMVNTIQQGLINPEVL